MRISGLLAALHGLLFLGFLNAAAAAAPAEACALLSAQQVSRAAGIPTSQGVPLSVSGNGCAWAGTGKSRVRVTMVLWAGSEWPRLQGPLPHTRTTVLTGLGDEAFYSMLGPFTSLSVKKADTIFVLHVYGITDAARQQHIEELLAGNVLAHL